MELEQPQEESELAGGVAHSAVTEVSEGVSSFSSLKKHLLQAEGQAPA